MSSDRTLDTGSDLSQRLMILGEMGVGLAHEVNNHLHVILANIELVEDGTSHAARGRIALVKDTVLQIKAMMQEMLMFSRKRKLRTEMLDVNLLIEKAVTLFRYQLDRSGIDLELTLCPGALNAECNKNLFPQVMLNLLKNARDSMSKARTGTMISIRSFYPHEREAVIEVSDNGPGIATGIHDEIFTPFYTTKAGDAGAGIGLSISRSIVEAIGGSIRVFTPEEGGAGFRITLPVKREPSARRA